MHPVKEKLVRSAKVLFLLGVVLLIVRQNSYPWLLKRASDVFFASSFLIIAIIITYFNEWGILKNVLKKAQWGFVLIFPGVVLATLSGYLFHGAALDREGLLNFFRLVEVAAALVAIGIFQKFDPNFFKKIAVAQLSTVIYFIAFFMPIKWLISYDVARFHLFENFPSNVGYYLLVSLSLACVWLLGSISPFTKKFFLYYVLGAGFAGVMLWTQSRASWVGFATAAALTVLVWISKKPLKIRRALTAGTLIASLFLFGFFITPKFAQNLILVRFFTNAYNHFDADIQKPAHSQTPSDVLQTITTEGLAPSFTESSRLILWPAYAKKLLREPLGLGLSYFPALAATYQGKPFGPHNTPLEVLAWGGIFALAGYAYLFSVAFKNILTRFKTGNSLTWPLYLFASLIALATASFFDNMISFRLMWIVLGMGIYL